MDSMFSLFGGILHDVKVGDYSPATNKAGQLLQLVTCDDQTSVLANAHPKAEGQIVLPPASPHEVYAQCEQFCHDLRALTHQNESIVRQGVASDHRLLPGIWKQFGDYLIQLLQFFITKPDTVQTTGPVAPPVALRSEPPPPPPKPELPKMSKSVVSPTPTPEQLVQPSRTDDGHDDEYDEDDEGGEDDTAPLPTPPSPPVPPKPSKSGK